MNIFDGHSDIWTDVAIRRQRGENNIFKTYHLPKLLKGKVLGIIISMWIEPEYTCNPEERFLQILGYVSEELEEIEREEDTIIRLVKNYQDMERAVNEQKLFTVIGLEGLSGIGENLNFISVLYRFGIRIISLTWNEENAFATGVMSPNKERGVTRLGKEAIKKIEELGIVLDVSHLNERSFWDLYRIIEKPIIASHSNVFNLCPVDRNLKDEQIKAIADTGGVVCVNAWGEFVDKRNPTIHHLIEHIDYITQLVGVDHVALGLDFCDYLSEHVMNHFSTQEGGKIEGLENITQVQNIINSLREKGYREEDLEKIAFKNLLRVFAHIIR